MAEDFVFGPAELTEEVVARRKETRGGLAHEHHISPADPNPHEQVSIRITVGPSANARDAWCYYTTDGSNPAGAAGVASEGKALAFSLKSVEWDDLVWGFVSTFEAVIPGQNDGTFVLYLIECDGRYANGGEGSATITPYFAYSVDSWQCPDWVRDAIMYYVMPDRFYPGDGVAWKETEDNSQIMGGTLQGIKDKLNYIQSMGFNTLWLMPWMDGPTYHNYGATDFYGVDPQFGTEEDLRDLITDAHERGFRVLVDFVGNHCSDEHPYFLDAKSNVNSKYRNWFNFGEGSQYESFFSGGELPQLNLNNTETRKYVFDLARYWVTEYGIDGYDLDYAIGPSHELWAAFSRSVREVSDEVVIFTEGVTTPESLLSYVGRVDGCQDFAWCQAARRVFGNGKITVEEFERFLSGSDKFFPSNFVAPIMLDNQNMDRFLLVAGNDQRKLRVAAACQYTMSQPISVWAGTEMGMSQRVSASENLNFVRDVTAWDDIDEETSTWFRSLAELRKKHPSLRRGIRTPMIADAQTGILAYSKSYESERCIVVLNTSETWRQVEIPGATSGSKDALGENALEMINGVMTLTVQGWSAAIIII